MYRGVVFFLLLAPFLFSESCPTMLRTPQKEPAFGEVRVKAIKGWDKLLTWALSPQVRQYALSATQATKSFKNFSEELSIFNQNYGYFSVYEPIVGMVTEEKRDFEVTNCLLEMVHGQIPRREQLTFTVEEILAKVMAYRNLKKGMRISFSTSKEKLQTYIVDEVINLWRGMPAFGLVPEKKNGVPPILLFRGTDLDLTSEKGWASILSDLDTNGPGLSTYQRARSQIHKWLKKAKKEHEPARVIGFSLGGVFVLYTMIFESHLVNHTVPSIAFNPPGVSKEILKKWEDVKKKPPHVTYVNAGDFVSQIGYFLSNVNLVQLERPLGVIEAHVTLISAQPRFFLTEVDVIEENAER